MSSDYRLLCLSHDPAIQITSDDLGRDVAEAVASRDHEELAGHRDCDVVLGRYSSPLVEVACFGIRLGDHDRRHCKGYHNGVEWVDRDWLRLLHAACAAGLNISALAPHVSTCWLPDRLGRLRDELGLPDQAQPNNGDGWVRLGSHQDYPKLIDRRGDMVSMGPGTLWWGPPTDEAR